MAATRLTPAPVISQIRDAVALNDNRFDNTVFQKLKVLCFLSYEDEEN
jgi:hypothetical protein